LNAVFCTLASDPAAAQPWKTAVVVRVLDEQPAALRLTVIQTESKTQGAHCLPQFDFGLRVACPTTAKMRTMAG
jgi:hypothetical protein